MITQDVLKELIFYDPETGILTWKERDLKWFNETEKRPATASHGTWNAKHAGKEAFSTITVYGYKAGLLFKKRYLSHQIVWFYMTGEWPNIIDHKNGNKLDNRFSNLRNVTHAENSRNKGMNRSNTSGQNCVFWRESRKRWIVQTKLNGKQIHIGSFKTFEEAKEAYKIAAKKLGFSDRHINGQN